MAEKGPDFFQKNPEQKWVPLDDAKPIEVVSRLEGALANKDTAEVQKILEDPQKIRTALNDRREKSKNLHLLRQGFDHLFVQEFGEKLDIFEVDSEKILKWLQKKGLPERILNDEMGISFLLKDDKRFFRDLTIISENESALEDQGVFPRALHDLATWELTIEKNPNKALDLNKQVLGKKDQYKDEVLETKARYGLTANKVGLKPKLKAGDFSSWAKIFAEHDAKSEESSALIEAAKAYLSLAKGQWGDSANLRGQNLEKAENLAQEALQKAIKLNYSNSILRAHDALGEIYQEMGDKQEAEKHENKAKKAREEIG